MTQAQKKLKELGLVEAQGASKLKYDTIINEAK